MGKVKHIIALVLSLTIILSCASVRIDNAMALSSTEDTIAIWDGTVATSLSGSGTEANPYRITNGAELAKAIIDIQYYNKYFELTNDIYLNDINGINWATGEAVGDYQIRDWSSKYSVGDGNSGYFDGNGHTVYGLYINNTSIDKNMGLVPNTYAGVKFSNWGIDYAYIKSTVNKSAGFFLAGTKPYDGSVSSFDNCYVGENCYMTAVKSAAGFVGCGESDISFSNSYSLANLTSSTNSSRVGAFIPDIWISITKTPTLDVVFTNCYGIGKYTEYTNDTTNTKFTFENCYSDIQSATGLTKVDAANMKGENALTYMPLGDAFVATKDYPALKVFPTKEEDDGIWNGSISQPTVGNGTESAPFEISNASQLAYVVYSGGNGRYYKLTADIYLNDIKKVDWTTGTPLDSAYTPNEWFGSETAGGTTYEGASSSVCFNGTIDGNSKTIYGLYYAPGSVKTAVGLIPCADNATIKNLRIKNSFISGGRWTASVVGFGKNTTFSQIIIDSDVTMHGYDAGNAYFSGTTVSSPFNGSIDSGIGFESEGFGGIIGYAYANSGGIVTIDNVGCFAYMKRENFGYSTKNPLTNGGKAKSVDNAGHYGGLIGTSWVTYINVSDSVSIGAPYDGKNGNGGFMAFTDVYCIEESKLDGVTCLEKQFISGLSSSNALSNLDFENVWKTTFSYPTLLQFYSSAEYSVPTLNIWDGTISEPTVGDGSETSPYELSTPQNLAWAVATGGNGKYYKLTSDIYLNDITKINWANGTVKAGMDYKPNAWYSGSTTYNKYNGTSNDLQFTGTLDGNGYTVYGLWYSPSTTEKSTGLIPAVNEATVKNLTLKYSYIAAYQYVGSLSSYFKGTISSCYIDETVRLASTYTGTTYIGGFVGRSQGITVSDSGFAGDIKNTTSYVNAYGFIGSASSPTSGTIYVTLSNSFTLSYRPFYLSSSRYYKTTDVYATKSGSGSTVVSADNMKGSSALNNMSGLNKNIWMPQNDSTPKLKITASAIGDVDADGRGATLKDAELLIKTLIGKATDTFADYDRNSSVDICDLVKLHIDPPVLCDDQKMYTFISAEPITDEYAIIYPFGDVNAKHAAEKLKKHFISSEGLTLTVATDKDRQTSEKEIRIGGTNRTIGSSNLESSQYIITRNGYTVEIFAGHDLSVISAVNEFIDLYEDISFSSIALGNSDFSNDIVTSKGNSYSYVWGDEFSANTMDLSKWRCEVDSSKMSGYDDLLLLDTEETVKIFDGNLRLTAMEYSDDTNSKIAFAAPASVHTQGRMEYRYGYAEIRAKLPFKEGVWPSFWAKSDTQLGGRKCIDYFVEVDVLEIFGSLDTVVPNIHKWYNKYMYDYDTIYGTSTNNHTQFNTNPDAASIKNFVYTDYTNLNDEYHIYGFEWTPTEMSFYIDGYCYQTMNIATSYDNYESMDGFQDPIYFIFNNHIFTPLSSYTAHAGEITGYESTNLPAHYDIDWFRLYQSDDVTSTQIWK